MAYTYFTAGFLFDDEHKRVLLIEKDHGPEYVVGKLNGIGGKFASDKETARECMIREFQEETGVLVESWEPFGRMTGPDWCCFLFRATDTKALEAASTVTSEVVWRISLNAIPPNVVPNLRYLIPAALNCAKGEFIRVEYD